MNKLGITKGEFEPKYVGEICIGIGQVGDYAQITANSILPETDEEYEKEKAEIEANMRLYADAGTTANKSGLLPSELLKQRDELREALWDIVKRNSLHDGFQESRLRAMKVFQSIENNQ